MDEPQLRHRGAVVTLPSRQGPSGVGFAHPTKFEGFEHAAMEVGPALGEHNVLLGLASEEVSAPQ